jgi:hypothetical protein
VARPRLRYGLAVGRRQRQGLGNARNGREGGEPSVVAWRVVRARDGDGGIGRKRRTPPEKSGAGFLFCAIVQMGYDRKYVINEIEQAGGTHSEKCPLPEDFYHRIHRLSHFLRRTDPCARLRFPTTTRRTGTGDCRTCGLVSGNRCLAMGGCGLGMAR